jgi:hypothetical protein
MQKAFLLRFGLTACQGLAQKWAGGLCACPKQAVNAVAADASDRL